MKLSIFGFLLIMWGLILLGGGIVVQILGPLSISGYGEWDLLFSSGVKGIIAIILVIGWIFILSKIKNWIFRKEMNL